jgi:hypothetical protein
MKSQRFIFFVLAIILIGLGLWWCLQPAKVGEPKAPVAQKPAKTETAKIEAPKPAMAPGKIAAPVAPPAQAVPTLVAAPAKAAEPEVASTDPQASWKTALPDIARMLRDNDIKAIMMAYAKPENRSAQLLQMGQKMNDRMQAEIADWRSQPNVSPEMLDRFTHPLEGEAAILEKMAEETPTMNDAGDEATFAVPEDKAKDMKPVTLVKIDGKWYLKEIVLYRDIRP